MLTLPSCRVVENLAFSLVYLEGLMFLKNALVFVVYHLPKSDVQTQIADHFRLALIIGLLWH